MSAVPINPALVPPGVGAGPAPAPGGAGGIDSGVFAAALAERTIGPEFSRHALERIQRRGIELHGTTLRRLTDGIARAAGKGARDSVVFVDGTAFVVSVANNTVITAVDKEHMRQQVFTNIDSAVIA